MHGLAVDIYVEDCALLLTQVGGLGQRGLIGVIGGRLQINSLRALSVRWLYVVSLEGLERLSYPTSTLELEFRGVSCTNLLQNWVVMCLFHGRKVVCKATFGRFKHHLLLDSAWVLIHEQIGEAWSWRESCVHKILRGQLEFSSWVTVSGGHVVGLRNILRLLTEWGRSTPVGVVARCESLSGRQHSKVGTTKDGVFVINALLLLAVQFLSVYLSSRSA